ncbi:MAG TPA: ABC transporter substrate-binding protein [Methylomirabilota bacterium]|nr:ABC transporter substrate-binding protein [Methylomirabilota bacterium]
MPARSGKNHGRSIGVGAAAVLAILALGGAGLGAAPVMGGTLVAGLDSQSVTLDPHASTAAISYLVASLNVTESLIYQQADGKFVPWLAAGYTMSPDGKTFTFSLRKDVSFSDGAPFNADTVKWNLDRIVNPSFKAGGSANALVGYTGTTVVDNNTVRVTFKEPYAPFLAYVAQGVLAMLSPKTTPTQGNDVNLRPVGSGPFTVAEYVAQDHITLARNAGYNRRAPWSDHQGPPYLDRIVWRTIPESNTRNVTIETGETQMIYLYSSPGVALAQLKGNKALRIETRSFPGSSYLWWLNVKLPPTDDVQVRRALSYAINRDAIVTSVYKGLDVVGCGLLSQNLLKDISACTYYPHNPAKAAQLLEEDGWKLGPNNVRTKGGKPLTLILHSLNYGGGNFPEVELIQGQLLALGIDAKIKSDSVATWSEDNYRCATNMGSIFLRTNEADAMYALFHSSTIGSNFNWSCYSNREVDALLQEGRAQLDPAKRRAVYLKVQHMLLEQAIAIPLMDKLSVWAVRDSVKGIKYNYSTYPALSDTYIQK